VIKVVGSESANWKIDDAHDVARRLFSANPRIKLLVCANDMMALGAIRYLQEAKLQGVKVVGYDALEEARQAMRAGWMTASVDQQAAQQGFMGVSHAVRMLKRREAAGRHAAETRPDHRERPRGRPEVSCATGRPDGTRA
jgi:ribose transport system substrate-binding protein